MKNGLCITLCAWGSSECKMSRDGDGIEARLEDLQQLQKHPLDFSPCGLPTFLLGPIYSLLPKAPAISVFLGACVPFSLCVQPWP